MSQPLYTLAQVADALNVPCPATPHTHVLGVSIDTRTLQPGDLFVALSGTPSGGFTSSFASKGDGHNFLELAQQNGAVAAIVSRPHPGLTIPQLVVEDTLLGGLWKLGTAARARMAGQLVALTGSAGKSTTKEMLATMLQAPASTASYNNFWGVPLTLARIPAEAPFAVAELGMNQPCEIARLAQLAAPNVALVVNVHPVHLENLGSLDAIRREKLAIATGLQPGGTLVVPHDLSLEGIGWQGRVVRFGPGAEVEATSHHPHGEDWHVTFTVAGQTVEATLREGAPHRLHNATAALACVYALGADVAAAAARLHTAGIMVGRGVSHSVGGVTVVDDSFNGNPASITAALQSLAGRPVAGRRIALLGDMLELGTEAPRYHTELAAACRGITGVFCVGPLMQNLYDALPTNQRLGYAPAPEAFDAAAFAHTLQQGDVVLIKGSKKMFYVHNTAQKLISALQSS